MIENGSPENTEAVDNDGVNCKYTKQENDTLIVHNLSKDDVGSFTCIVNTAMNFPENITHVVIDDMASAGGLILILEQNLLPIVIAIIIVALVIILLSIVCIRRRRNKRGIYSIEKEKVS